MELGGKDGEGHKIIEHDDEGHGVQAIKRKKRKRKTKGQ
jgi:hypothetical protein